MGLDSPRPRRGGALTRFRADRVGLAPVPRSARGQNPVSSRSISWASSRSNDESTHPDGVSRIPGTTHALATTSTFPYDNATRFYSQVLQYS